MKLFEKDSVIIGSIEGGGTKFVVALVEYFDEQNYKVHDRTVIDTTTPDVTMKQVIYYFADKTFDAIGLATFGPIDPNKKSALYGYITSTPKKGWTNYNIVGELKKHFDCLISFDTDVNGSAIGELNFGAAKGLDTCLYLTIGTGVGGGIVINNKTVNGLLHPEVGHMLVTRHSDDKLESTCAYHDNCVEGLSCGPAIEKRYGQKAYELPVDHEAWELTSYYLAQAISNLILTVSPEKIILGGGVMKQTHLLPMIKENVLNNLNGYVVSDIIKKDDYIVNPQLGDDAGIVGSSYIALQELILLNE